MQINTNNTGIAPSYFTRQNLGFTTDQKSFDELRAQNPAPLSKGAQQLVEVRGLRDPVPEIPSEKIDVYA